MATSEAQENRAAHTRGNTEKPLACYRFPGPARTTLQGRASLATFAS